jgi:glutamate synthase domain-containing protein 2
MLRTFHLIGLGSLVAAGLLCLLSPWWSLLFLVLVPAYLVGLRDSLQTKHSILRNFPLLGQLRYFFEAIRPEIRQYFIESNTDGRPIPRERRSVIYQRAKGELETLPFGTQKDVYEPGYEWIGHSMAARAAHHGEERIPIGGRECKQIYAASVLNVSAMSYGSLSAPAVEALNLGAKAGDFWHNTGEGGISDHHLHGGDLCWQIGTGYFGARGKQGDFDPEAFRDNAARPEVQLIELKLSQGAKPGHGGILPKAKITPEIARIRGVGFDADVLSPPRHSAFNSPVEMMEFVSRLRELSGGKPVGLKFCVGQPEDVVALCKAMLETEQLPDYIAIDGGEGGTGAAPLEFSNAVGAPLFDGLNLVQNALVGFGLRDRLRLVASGGTMTGFDLATRLAAGADLVQAARAFMLSLGCIQARKCHSNDCPTGVATQLPHLTRGLVVADKAKRVTRWHAETVEALYELLGAAGLQFPSQLRPHHIHRRISQTKVRSYADIYEYLSPGQLLTEEALGPWSLWMARASAESFYEGVPS